MTFNVYKNAMFYSTDEIYSFINGKSLRLVLRICCVVSNLNLTEFGMSHIPMSNLK